MTSKSHIPDGHLDKNVLRRHVEFACDRQLALDLGRFDERWFEPVGELYPTKRPSRPPDLLKELGKLYEQDVYARLRHSTLQVMHAVGSYGRVVTTQATPQIWRGLEAHIRSNGQDLVLLEHQWSTPETLLSWVLDTLPGEPLPVAHPSQFCRPDMVILHQRQGLADRELKSWGFVQAVQKDDPRVAIRLVDIKHTQASDVGKKHFIELIFYAHSLAAFLENKGLDDLFFVSLDGHGVWPVHNLNRLRLAHVDDVANAVVEMNWDNYAHLFTLAASKIREIRSLAPRPVDDLDVHIQSSCARCRYLSDCKASLGYKEDAKTLEEVDVRLMPCTSPSIAEELRDKGVSTVGDLDAQVDLLQFATDVPSPIYSERPLLRLKARAMSRGNRVLPSQHDASELRHMSMALPYRSDVVATFNVEADPSNGCVFALGVHLDVSCSNKAPWVDAHNKWWRAFGALLRSHRRAGLVDVEPLFSLIGPELRTYFLEKDETLTLNALSKRVRARLRLFVELLFWVHQEGDLQIVEEEGGAIRVRYCYAFVAQGYLPEQERRMAMVMVRQFQALISLSAIYEQFVCAIRQDAKVNRSYVIGPSAGIFYWSHDQLEHVQDLLERHLTELMTEPDICTTFHELLHLLNPSESSVQRDFLHKKVFDLRVFVETSVGLPEIINYTWHQIASRELPHHPKFSRSYWPENFSHMDFLAWHEFLRGQDASKAEPLRVESQRKAATLAHMVRHFMRLSQRDRVVPKLSRATPTYQIPWHAKLVGNSLNFLARAWALYARLTAAVDAQEALTSRLTYPLFSVGKLVAGHVESLEGTIDPDGKTQRFSMVLRGVSANMKIDEGDYLLLVHESNRADVIGPYAGEHVIVEQLTWDVGLSGYRVGAVARWGNHPYFRPDCDVEGDWYFYPSVSDTWSTKLFEGKKDTLYGRYNLGNSWLGDRLAYLLDLFPADRGLTSLEQYTFSLAEVYMYAPHLLPSLQVPESSMLHTNAVPSPDLSQREAIQMAMNHTISCIQGPPGTGKSQTIAALIDEFITRSAHGPVRILVTCASYTPLYVVLNNLLKQRDEQGALTPAAQMQKVFLRASYRDPVVIDGVHDLCRVSGDNLVLDGVTLSRGRDKAAPGGWKRLETYLDESFIVFAPSQQLFYLGRPSSSKSKDFHLVHDDFAFDLIVVDEASQMPVDQAMTSMCLVRRGEVSFEVNAPMSSHGMIEDRAVLEGMNPYNLVDRHGQPMAPEHLTKVVLVGDHNQLPPVQKVEASRKLQPILGSLFSYFVRHHNLPSYQLTTNYRSAPEVVGFTRHLGLYDRYIDAFHQGDHAWPDLPSPDSSSPEWVQQVLNNTCVVSTLIHNERYETAVSPLEATVVCQLVQGFFNQMKPSSEAQERLFWQDHVGIVAPHNAQGRLIIRTIANEIASLENSWHTHLDAAELESLLRGTIYTVDRFQGSARTFIIASIGVSAAQQLAREEEFLYDMNRFNVLTSRARQKMIMVCSQTYLDHTPSNRDVVPAAARSREYALVYCNQHRDIKIHMGDGRLRVLRFRWHDPQGELTTVPRPAQKAASQKQPSEQVEAQISETQMRAILAALGKNYDTLSSYERVLMLEQLRKLTT